MGGVTLGLGGLVPACGTDEVGNRGGLLVDGGSGGASGDSGAGGSGGGVSRTSPFGKACLKDSDCGLAGLTCLTSASDVWAGQGPPNGICSLACQADADCQGADPSSLCLGFPGTANAAFCMQSCMIGSLAARDEKCHGRTDVACDDSVDGLGAGVGFCRPMCRSDLDCGDRRCDLGSGFCNDASALGTLPIGSPCDPSADSDPCSGVCVRLSATTPTRGVCMGSCTIGAFGCGETDPQEPPKALCLFDGTTAGTAGEGDVGICGQLCDCDGDCLVPGRVCRPFTVDEANAVGRFGYCTPPTDSSGNAIEHIVCEDAGAPPDAGGSGGAGGGGTGGAGGIDGGSTGGAGGKDAGASSGGAGGSTGSGGASPDASAPDAAVTDSGTTG